MYIDALLMVTPQNTGRAVRSAKAGQSMAIARTNLEVFGVDARGG
jgi:hypothetical protein